MTDFALIYLRGEGLRDIAWTLLEKGLIETADSVVCYEAYLKNGSKRKMSSNASCMHLVARQETLEAAMAYLQGQGASACAVPVLARV